MPNTGTNTYVEYRIKLSPTYSRIFSYYSSNFNPQSPSATDISNHVYSYLSEQFLVAATDYIPMAQIHCHCVQRIGKTTVATGEGSNPQPTEHKAPRESGVG